MNAEDVIHLRGVRVHNLRSIDLEIPRRNLVVICGVSGAGKSSLAKDTLYAEGQRRYIESFPARTRQFLQKLDRPEADLIEGIPPAVTVEPVRDHGGRRNTVSTVADIAPLLQLLFARLGIVTCPGCGREVRQDSPQTVAHFLGGLPEGRRLMVAFPWTLPPGEDLRAAVADLREEGFVRAAVGDTVVELSSLLEQLGKPAGDRDSSWLVVVDRLHTDRLSVDRVRESLETAFAYGDGRCCVLVEATKADDGADRQIGGRWWRSWRFSVHWACEECHCEVAEPQPQLFNPWSPLGACPECEGSGTAQDWDWDRIFPDSDRTILGGAVAPWHDASFPYQLTDFLRVHKQLGVRVHVAWRMLSQKERDIVRLGCQSSGFDGVQAQLEAFASKARGAAKRKVTQWKGDIDCPACGGTRLRAEGLAVQLGEKNIAQVERLSVPQALVWLESLSFAAWQQPIAKALVPQLKRRLELLEEIGVGYLSLDRPMESLSRGEAQRVAFASALGSSLVNLLYVLDEPTAGLHPHDIQRIVTALETLRDRGSTVVVVDHSELILRAADRIVEIGPGAGADGGRVEFEGSLEELIREGTTRTADYLTGRREVDPGSPQHREARGWLSLYGASGHNLKKIDVRFPLGVLCAVTGVSGAGKSTLVHQTLYAELRRRMGKAGPKPLPLDRLEGSEQLDEVVWIDRQPPAQVARSNPATYARAFGEIRRVFAETVDARIHNYTAGDFSFNVEGGRCEECKGEGSLTVDMQFLASVRVTCPVCQGRRFRERILEVTYRGKNIAEVLEMTVAEAFRFFRGERKVQARLQRLMDVRLDYLRLGQPLDTLSSGEGQRLKLAGHLASGARGRTLFLLEEPSAGLHDADLVKLLDCFDSLLAVGHSLIIIEHHPKLIRAADYVIDLGPGPAEDGGTLVVAGTPDEVASCPASLTGQWLKSPS